MAGLRYDEPDDPSKPVVTTDVVADENIELVKLAYGGPTDAIRVTEETPFPARDYHGGTIPFDTGLVDLTDTPAIITASSDVWVDALLLVNRTTEVQGFTLTDGADTDYGGVELQPREMRPIPLFGLLFEGGVKMVAVNDGAIAAQVKGTR